MSTDEGQKIFPKEPEVFDPIWSRRLQRPVYTCKRVAIPTVMAQSVAAAYGRHIRPQLFVLVRFGHA